MRITKYNTISAKAICCLTFIFACNHANASLHDTLANLAQEYVYLHAKVDSDADLRVSATSIDSRINIPTCESGYQFEASDASLRQTNVSVKITCPDNDWYLFTNIQAEQTKPVAIFTDVMSPGTLLTKDNIEIADIPIGRLRGSTFADIQRLEGARLKRRVRPGQVIGSNMLCFVCKGDSVTIVAETAGLQLKVSGIAKQDGNLGDSIRVENAASKKLVTARVTSTQQVTVRI